MDEKPLWIEEESDPLQQAKFDEAFDRLRENYHLALVSDPELGIPVRAKDLVVLYEHADVWAKVVEQYSEFMATWSENVDILARNLRRVVSLTREPPPET